MRPEFEREMRARQQERWDRFRGKLVEFVGPSQEGKQVFGPENKIKPYYVNIPAMTTGEGPYLILNICRSTDHPKWGGGARPYGYIYELWRYDEETSIKTHGYVFVARCQHFWDEWKFARP